MNGKILSLLYSLSTVTNLIPLCLASSESSGVSSQSDLDPCNRTIETYETVSGPPVTELNRGKPLHCFYRIKVRPLRDDWIVFVRFTRLKVGELSEDRQKCIGGYVQIIDGFIKSNYSNKEHSGYHCGEIDMPKTFISETPNVKIVFHVDRYDHDSYIQFDANAEQQQSFSTRYGHFHQLYPHRRGIPVVGTYCERIYSDCSPGPRCFIQSPGYPGIYPRNLRCRYHLNARQSLVGLELSAFDVDGQACDNLLMCFPRPVSTKENECPFDYVRIYDGSDEFSPIIATLCGKGRIKSSIISSTSNMLVEFVTSPAGPLLSTGFHFKADSIIDTGNAESIQLSNGSCIIERQLSDSNVANLFTNIRSWYPSNTTCLYKFTAHDTKDLISLEFLWFRIERVTLCQESVRLFDGLEADMSTLMTRLCDMNKPQSGATKTTYVSSGPALVVQFSSLIGSLDGSSINYGFDIRLIPPPKDHDLNDISKSCSKHITPDTLTSGSVSWNYEELNKSGSSPIQCNLTFDASSIQHGRVNVSMYSPFTLTNCNECESHLARIVVYRNIDIAHPMQSLCYCKLSRGLDTSYVISTGAQMIISLQLPAEWGAQQHHFALIQVIYRFFSETRCGPNEILTTKLSGVLNFPFSTDVNYDNKLIRSSFEAVNSLSFNSKNEAVFCVWKLPLFPQLDVAFSVELINCTTDFLLLKDMQVCPQSKQNQSRRDIIIKSEDISSQYESVPRNSHSSNVVTIYYGSTNPANNSFLLLKYTQLKLLLPISSGDHLVSMGRNCEFLCTNPPACLKQELVCNGVANCPGLGSGGVGGEDEDEAMCKRTNYWGLLMKESTTLLAVAVAAFLILCFITFTSICVCRRMRKKRQRF